MRITTLISIIISVALVLGVIILTNSNNNSPTTGADNVTIENGKQIVYINAKNGYQPRKSMAQANIPTEIIFNTKNTFDCSSSIRIPSLGISKLLPQTGKTNIEIGNQKVGNIKGSCGMGMYPFEIEFKN